MDVSTRMFLPFSCFSRLQFKACASSDIWSGVHRSHLRRLSLGLQHFIIADDFDVLVKSKHLTEEIWFDWLHSSLSIFLLTMHQNILLCDSNRETFSDWFDRKIWISSLRLQENELFLVLKIIFCHKSWCQRTELRFESINGSASSELPNEFFGSKANHVKMNYSSQKRDHWLNSEVKKALSRSSRDREFRLSIHQIFIYRRNLSFNLKYRSRSMIERQSDSFSPADDKRTENMAWLHETSNYWRKSIYVCGSN